MKDTITIRQEGNTWVAEHSNLKVKTLFGTNTLPTPFLTATPKAEVIRKIQQLNPDMEVK